ncbi:MAG: isoprenoid biosynthesis glyoxalase ElbB [Lentimicrobiaceae bacterium]|jgi:enhancing lycopene biosynthesis protein 2|nr:isoprenoid biosynthesis glyoxalase ElbB [Lentimicrobiaceae bacterium]
MKKFAVVLAGCGTLDGAEIHEATLLLLAIKKAGASYEIFAPDIPQYYVINHITGEEMPEKRNIMVEAARIARGKIKEIDTFCPDQFDVLAFPGGTGFTKNMCNFAFKGAECEVHPKISRAILKMAETKKPIAAMCIAPVALARVLNNVQITLGAEPSKAVDAIKKMGARHIPSTHGEVVYDEKYNVFTTPSYMLDASITDVAEGADKLVAAILSHLG